MVLVAGKGVCQRYPAGILIYMTMKSMILFMINYLKPEVKHEIATELGFFAWIAY